MLLTSWMLYIIFVAVVHSSDAYNSFGTMYVAFNSPKLYLAIILSVGTNFLFDMATYSGHIALSNSLIQTLRVVTKERGFEYNTEAGSPDIVIQYINLYNNIMAEAKSKSEEERPKINFKANERDLKKVDLVDLGNVDKHNAHSSRDKLNGSVEMIEGKKDSKSNRSNDNSIKKNKNKLDTSGRKNK